MYGQGGSRDDINKLIRLFFDSKEDFRLAAKRATDSAVRDELSGLCDRREHFHMQLQQEITQHGVEMSDNGTTKADFKRDWERLRGNVAGHGFEAALKLASTSETEALEIAQSLVKRDLPPTIKVMIERQVSEIQETLNRIQDLLSTESVAP